MAILFLSFSLGAQETGDIQIKCEAGVQIFLDGAPRGVTTAEEEGLVIQKVPAGTRKIRAVWKDSSIMEGSIEVVPGRLNTVRVGKVGRILVKCEAGVKIFLDGFFVGETDAAKGGLVIENILIGKHKIKALKEGYPAQEGEVDLGEGGTTYSMRPFGAGSRTQGKGEADAAGGKTAKKGKAAAPEEGPRERENSLGMRLRVIPAGEVEVDLPEGSVGAEADSVKAIQRGGSGKKAKAVQVRIPKAFEISACEVKMSDFEKVLGKKPKTAATDFRLERLPGKTFPNLPAMSVSWEEAAEFCRKLSERPEEKEAGTRYRLPTEAEWALARKTGNSQSPCFSWAQRKIPRTIWELCSNFYEEAYYKNMPSLDPQGPAKGSRRVARLAYGDPTWSQGWCTFRVVAEGRHLEEWAVKKAKVEAYERAVREGSQEPSPIDRGLRWLARHQDPDGRWSTSYFGSHCPEKDRCSGPGRKGFDYDVGLTGLALLAFLGRGSYPVSDYLFEDSGNPGTILSFNDAADNGLRWLAQNQNAEGCFPKKLNENGPNIYDHAIATQAMAKGARLAGDQTYKDAAQKGIDFLIKAQNPGFGWRYEVRTGESDTSVTAWCAKVLREAELSGLKFDQANAYHGVLAWLKGRTSGNGGVGYISPGDTGSIIVAINDKWMTHPSMTAAGLLSKLYAEKNSKDPWLRVAAGIIVKDLPVWDERNKTVDSYYWHYGTLALREFDGPNGPAWKTFRPAILKALVPFQGKKGACAEGSWDPMVDKWGIHAGRIYTTAINILTLEAAEGIEK